MKLKIFQRLWFSQARRMSVVHDTNKLEPSPLTKPNPMIDKFGRMHDYLRISLTERCNLRCRYCMPAEGVQLSPRDKLMRVSEIEELARLFVRLGVRTIRLTGGEPLVRRELVDIVARLNSLKVSDGLKKIVMTTNGVTLSHKLAALLAAGLDGVNISMDTLIPAKFERLTRRRGFEKVWRAINDCIDSGMTSVKVNCVVMRNVNDDEIVDFVRLTQTMPIDVRFIEYMPFGGNKWELSQMVSYQEMRSRITDAGVTLYPVATAPSSTAKMFSLTKPFGLQDASTKVLGRVGFITSNTAHFCGGCNRLRVTADGRLKHCLHDNRETSLLEHLRSVDEDGREDRLVEAIRRGLGLKKAHHDELKVKREGRYGEKVKKSQLEVGQTSSVPLTHIDNVGQLRMVDVGHKQPTTRSASASCVVLMRAEVAQSVLDNAVAKGDVLTVAKVAGIQAAKTTYQLIPLCHQIQLSKVAVELFVRPQLGMVQVQCSVVAANERTGVEMEALMGCATAALTIYDMCKAADRLMSISDLQVDRKCGGASGDFQRQPATLH